MGKDERPALSLIFDPKVPRVPGQVLDGEVHIYFPTLLSDNIEEIHLKLRGSIVTKITRQSGQSQVTRRQRIDLARENISLWQKGSPLYPPPDSHVLVIPFHFQLPFDLPPSCSFKGVRWSGAVGYALELVGQRSGLHFDRRIFLSFPVLPPDAQGAELRSAISTGGWQGGWMALERRNDIRRGIWGDYSEVKATLVMPDLQAFPMNTPIPFNLNVVTITKPMKTDDVKEGERIFPAPPIHPKELSFELNRMVDVRARSWTKSSTDSAIARLGGFGESILQQYYADVQIEPMDKVWIPSHDEKHGKGQWKQEVTMKSLFTLRHCPTFFTDALSVKYSAELKIEFPGIGNDLKFVFPLNIISCMPLPGAQGWDAPPPDLDLPPSYFAGEEWHNDEKGDE